MEGKTTFIFCIVDVVSDGALAEAIVFLSGFEVDDGVVVVVGVVGDIGGGGACLVSTNSCAGDDDDVDDVSHAELIDSSVHKVSECVKFLYMNRIL